MLLLPAAIHVVFLFGKEFKLTCFTFSFFAVRARIEAFEEEEELVDTPVARGPVNSNYLPPILPSVEVFQHGAGVYHPGFNTPAGSTHTVDSMFE